jgi:hypothetical protein
LKCIIPNWPLLPMMAYCNKESKLGGSQGAFPGGVVVNGKNLSESVRITREVVANPEVPVICGSESHAGRATKMA